MASHYVVIFTNYVITIIKRWLFFFFVRSTPRQIKMVSYTTGIDFTVARATYLGTYTRIPNSYNTHRRVWKPTLYPLFLEFDAILSRPRSHHDPREEDLWFSTKGKGEKKREREQQRGSKDTDHSSNSDGSRNAICKWRSFFWARFKGTRSV